jgi:hypothetical protein
MCTATTIKIILFLFPILELSAGCSKPDEKEEILKTECLLPQYSLPSELNENSGMIWYDGLVWMINDSGGYPYIYAFDTATASIIKRIHLAGAENTDWEEIAQDELNLYVGDFGNNDGSRRDLRIYKISKSDLHDTIVAPEIIYFSYPDQSDYTSALYNTPFDCEAMISTGDTLLLFSKNWTGGDMHIYEVPAVQGNYVAVLADSLKIDGQVTASAYSAVNHCLYLLGYYNFIPFLCLLQDFIPGDNFKGSVQSYSFPESLGTQTEGIALSDNGEILISCEKGYGEPAMFKAAPCQ